MGFFYILFIILYKNKINIIKNEVKNHRIKSLLIINRKNEIGDAVLSIKPIKYLSKIFDKIYIFSEKNKWIYLNELNSCKNISLIDSNSKELYTEKFDLVLDLISDWQLLSKIKAKYKVGLNRGLFSFLNYDAFYPYNMTESKLQYTNLWIDVCKHLFGIEIKIDDLPPKDFKKKKMNQIFIFVGNKPNRNLPYEKWKELILLSAKKAKTIVADDPDQRIMNQLKKDKEIIQNKDIYLVIGTRELKYLAKIANDSKLFIALDGGAEHYLERYTNSVVFYTCGFPYNWKPYSLNPYRKISTNSSHVLEETITSAGLRKYVFYNIPKRKPCYDLVCDYKEFKKLKFNLLSDLLC
ncbi:MAG: hypothetical protein QXY18_05795 [Nitrososphaerota archaeon]